MAKLAVKDIEQQLEDNGYTLIADDVLPGGEGTRIYEAVKGREKIEIAISITKVDNERK